MDKFVVRAAGREPPGAGASSSKVVQCPICGKHVHVDLIGMHLDLEECEEGGGEGRRGREGAVGSKRARGGAGVLDGRAAAAAVASEVGVSVKDKAKDEAETSWPIRWREEAGRGGVPPGFRDPKRVSAGAPGAWREAANASTTAECDGYERVAEGPPGQVVILDFVTEEEEAEIVAAIEAEGRMEMSSWNGPHLGARWGVEPDMRTRKVLPPKHKMPGWTAVLVARWRERVPYLRDFQPNECNAIDYRRDRGHVLQAHCDDRRMSSDIIVNLSLCGDAVMEYTLDGARKGKARAAGRPRDGSAESKDAYRVHLPRRSLQVQAGACRFDFMHGIANADLPARRLSVTFRHTLLPA